MFRSICACSAVALALAAVTAPAHASSTTKQIYGLDVYSGNGTQNWTLIAGGGRDFAWTKGTEGTSFQDPLMATNEANGTAAGLLMGIYDFAHPESHRPTQEATYFVNFGNTANAFASGKLVPSLDLESGLGSGTINDDNGNSTTIANWALEWCNDVFNLTGVKPVIYCNQNYAGNLTAADTAYAIWIASYDHNNTPSVGPYANYTFLQYTGSGRLAGAQPGDVDEDYYNGSLSSLISTYAIGGTAPAALLAQLPDDAPEPSGVSALVGVGILISRRRRARR